MKRAVFLTDLHCGSVVGLTPTDWQAEYQTSKKKSVNRKHRLSTLRGEEWDWFTKEIKSLGKIDFLGVLGDCVDGPGEKQGGTDQLTTSVNEQVEMAIDCLLSVKAKNKVMVYGTPYHTGSKDDAEDIIAREIGARIGGHEQVEIDGVVFDLKHKVGGSQIPHGRSTAIMRERLWNKEWADVGGSVKADVILRGHVHYFNYTGNANYLAMTLPALQCWGSKYGTRQCSGIVDVGFVHFDIDKGAYTWQAHVANLKAQKARVHRI